MYVDTRCIFRKHRWHKYTDVYSHSEAKKNNRQLWNVYKF